MFDPGSETVVLLAVVICELILLAFLFCIARFYELKFKETTYYVSYLLPVFLFVIVLIFSMAGSLEPEWASLFTNVCALIVLATAGLFLYGKMTGVSP